MGVTNIKQTFPPESPYTTEIIFEDGTHIYSNRSTLIRWFEVFAMDSLIDCGVDINKLHLFLGRDYRGWI